MKGKSKLFYQYLSLTIKIILLSWIIFLILFIFFVVSKIKSTIFLRKDKLLSYLNNHLNEIKALGNSRISNLEIKKIHKGVANLIWEQTISFDGGKKITLVGKKFLPFGSIITFISSSFGPWPKGIPLSTKKRFRQEVNALRALRSDSIDIPEIVFFDDRQELILMEYIPGTDLGDFLEQIEMAKEVSKYFIDLFYNCGRSLAMLHRCGISLISHNDRSRILKRTDGRIYFVDFELSTLNDYRAWDLAIFIHWIRIKLGFADRQKIDKIEGAFIKGYKALGSVEQQAINRHLEGLRIYIPFAKIGLWINRKRKYKPIGELK